MDTCFSCSNVPFCHAPWATRLHVVSTEQLKLWFQTTGSCWKRPKRCDTMSLSCAFASVLWSKRSIPRSYSWMCFLFSPWKRECVWNIFWAIPSGWNSSVSTWAVTGFGHAHWSLGKEQAWEGVGFGGLLIYFYLYIAIWIYVFFSFLLGCKL